MDWLTSLKLADLIVGLIIAVFAVTASIIAWAGRRVRRTAAEVTGVIDERQRQTGDKLTNLAAEHQALARRMTSLETEQHKLRSEIQGLASAKAVADLDRKVAHMDGSVTAQLKSLSGMMDSFHRSALRAASRKD